jgi:hypothetical protein
VQQAIRHEATISESERPGCESRLSRTDALNKYILRHNAHQSRISSAR